MRPPPAEPGPQSPPSQSSATPTARDTVLRRKAGVAVPVGLTLAAGIVSWPWFGNRPMAAGSALRRSSRQRHHCRRKIRRRNRLRLPFSWPRLRLCRRKWRHHQHRRRRSLRRPRRRRKPDRRRPHRRHRIKRSCCRRWRATWRIWSATSNSSGRTSNRWQATTQRRSGAEGEPGRDEACARQGSRSGAAQGVIAAGAARYGLAQAGTAAVASESAAEISIPAGMALRRLVAAER